MRRHAAVLASAMLSVAAAQESVHEPPAESQAAASAAALDPVLRETLAPVMRNWITSSRDGAVQRGVATIPSAIRAALEGWVADEILDAVRWRVDDSIVSVQQGLFRLGYTPAVTLDYVVVFATRDDALDDPALWAHELVHVRQFRDWGVNGFVERYLEDYAAVEHDAAEFRWQWMKATGRMPSLL